MHSSGYDLLVPTSEQERPLIEIGASTRMILVTKLFKDLIILFFKGLQISWRAVHAAKRFLFRLINILKCS